MPKENSLILEFKDNSDSITGFFASQLYSA